MHNISFLFSLALTAFALGLPVPRSQNSVVANPDSALCGRGALPIPVLGRDLPEEPSPENAGGGELVNLDITIGQGTDPEKPNTEPDPRLFGNPNSPSGVGKPNGEPPGPQGQGDVNKPTNKGPYGGSA